MQVQPFPKCCKNWRLMSLSKELRRYAGTLTGEADRGQHAMQGALPFIAEEVAPVPSYQPGGDTEAWWAAWRAAVLAA